MFHPGSRRVAAHTDTLAEARKDAAYWTQTTSSPIDIQKRFPSGAWVTIETKQRQGTSIPARPKRTSSTSKKTAHATKVKTVTGDKLNIDQIAKLFDLPDWNRIDYLNQQNYWEMARSAEGEDAQLAAEREAQNNVYGQWYDAVERAASKLFEEHGLELDPTGKQGTKERRYDFKIVPSKSWDDAANKLRETINGVGTFHFDNLREFLGSGPYTARQAVLAHLGYIKRYPAVAARARTKCTSKPGADRSVKSPTS